MPLPSRVIHADLARVQFGPLADRMFAALMQGDELADEATHCEAKWIERAVRGEAPKSMPAPLRRLVEQMRQPPAWVDYDRCDEAGRLLFRAGPLGGMVLGARSLVGGYAAPAGNKPLAFSGQLERDVQFRLAETGRFVVSTCERGGLRPGNEGWGITMRVRLMHARVRQILAHSARWRMQDWAMPINQHDMVGTSLLFSTVFVDGLRLLGMAISNAEEDDYTHLWRVSGWLMGIDPAIQPKDAFESYRLGELIRLTQKPPDDDSRALTKALFEAPRLALDGKTAERPVNFGYGLAFALLGRELAEQLGVPKTPYRFFAPAMHALMRLARPFTAGSGPRFERLGHQYWAKNLQQGFGQRSATYSLPTKLLGRALAA